jgi:hypothetical protein
MTAAIEGDRVSMNIDAYGTYGRQGALADYLEVAALAGTRVTEAALARSIEEYGWARLPRRQFLTIDNIDEDPAAWAESVFSTIRERAQLLGERYPFGLERTSLRLRILHTDLLDSPYLALLAITVLHAWKLTPRGGPLPENVLEDLVARALENRGLLVSRMGARDRASSSFVDAVIEGGKSLGLNPMTDPLPRKRSAKDAGIDTLAGLTWIDGRSGGQWLFVGQVTVGESGTWERKLNEPKPALWAAYMQEPLDPQAFLAVPHHIDGEHLVMMTKPRTGLILDRLRLCQFMGLVSADERALIEQLLHVVVE